MYEKVCTMTPRYLTAAAMKDLRGQLTEYDYALIKCVSDLRYVTGSQLTRQHFAVSPDAVVNARASRRALLRLVRLNVLERLARRVGGARAGSAGFVYRLAPAGQRLAVERGWQSEGRRRRSQVPGTLFVDHALKVAELHTLLTEADRSRIIELLELVAEPACWRSYGGVGGQQCTLKPDSYVRLGAGAYEDSYFIEVDMGTEGSRALQRKLKDYLDCEASGIEQAARGVFPKTLWLVPHAERASAIGECIERLPRSSQELFAVELFSESVQIMSNTSSTPKDHTST
jgi:hypothetical protein